MSVLDGLEFLPEARARPDAKPADTRPEPGVLEAIGASFRASRADIFGATEMERYNAYVPLVDALEDAGFDRRAYRIDPRDAGGANWDYRRIWRDISALSQERRRQLGFPESQEAFDKKWMADFRDRTNTASETAARGGLAPQLIGGIGAAATDPINMITLPYGGVAKSAAGRILSEGAINAVVEAFSQPLANVERAQQGRAAITPGEMATNVASAAALGMGVRTAIEFGPGAARAVDDAGYRALAPVRERIDRFLGDRDMARAFGELVPDHLRTPEQAAAVQVLARDAEISRASPFADTYDGLDAHGARLAEAMDRLDQPAPGPPAPRPAPAARAAGPDTLHGGIVAFLRRAGLPQEQARGIAAGIHAESASNPRAVNPASGAYGIGQWLGPRKDALMKRYGPNPTMEQQLEFLVWELRGGDHGGRSVLAQADEAGALRSYIEDFMRPAKGAETTGDLQRGMAALGRGGEDAGAFRGEAGDDGLALALEAEQADVAAARQRADALDEGIALAPRQAEQQLGAPVLRRDLFADETSWRIAQAQADAEALGVEPIVTRQSVWEAARDRLMAEQGGEVPGALYHPEIGPIDVKWGNSKGGLAHIVAKHEEVLADLPRIIAAMEVGKTTANRIHLESPDHVAKVRLDYDGAAQKWLLTAYQKRGKALPATEDGGAAGPLATGRQDRSPGAGAAPDIGDGAASGNMQPGDLLANYWANARDPQPVFVARDGAGAVLGWSRDGGELAARMGGEGVTVRRESGPDGEVAEGSTALTEQDAARFDDPAGDGTRAAAESDWHDVRADPAMAALEIDLGDGKGPRQAGDVAAEIDADRASIEAIRGCLK